jgi:methionyl-tRNA formyltransferase
MPDSANGLNTIFMGTPDFAVPALKTLAASRHTIALVVTQPDRPKGRGRKLTPPPVKAAAQELGLEVIQPTSVKTAEFVERIIKVKPDIFVVVAFGHLLPQTLLDIPRLGAINIHASLLPKYRGAAPIHWAIIKGEKETGVTIMQLDEGMDSGDILLAVATEIRPRDTTESMHKRLSKMGAGLLIQALDGLMEGSVHPEPQDHSRASQAPRLKKSDGRIDWNQPTKALDAFIRGMTPWPGAFTFTFKDEMRLKILRAEPLSGSIGEPPGTILEGKEGELHIATADGALCITEIQGASGKRLPIHEFLRGCPLVPGTSLT